MFMEAFILLVAVQNGKKEPAGFAHSTGNYRRRNNRHTRLSNIQLRRSWVP